MMYLNSSFEVTHCKALQYPSLPPVLLIIAWHIGSSRSSGGKVIVVTRKIDLGEQRASGSKHDFGSRSNIQYSSSK
jgi:hypothetical protein